MKKRTTQTQNGDKMKAKAWEQFTQSAGIIHTMAEEHFTQLLDTFRQHFLTKLSLTIFTAASIGQPLVKGLSEFFEGIYEALRQ